MQKWEYLTITRNESTVSASTVRAINGAHIEKDRKLFYPYIKELGEQGWELVLIEDNEFFFKKPKENSN